MKSSKQKVFSTTYLNRKTGKEEEIVVIQNDKETKCYHKKSPTAPLKNVGKIKCK